MTKILYPDITKKKVARRKAPTSKNIQKSTEKLRARFFDTLLFFKKHRIAENPKARKRKVTQLPWYFVIGPTGTGKTSLLLNSGIPYILSKKMQDNSLTPTKDCDWWVSPHQVFFDTNGHFIMPSDGTTELHYLWETCLTLPAEVRGKKALAGIVLVLDIDFFQQALPVRREFLEHLAKQLNTLQTTYEASIPITLIINKTDKIPGFQAFFHGLGPKQREQTFGIKLPLEADSKIMKGILSAEFTTLLDTLNKSLLVRLHEEKELNTREDIKEFPLQLESLRPMILGMLRGLMESSQVVISGIYFTSASPQQPLWLTHTSSSTNSGKKNKKIFFIKQLLSEVLSQAPIAPATPPTMISKIICATLCIVFVALSLWWLHDATQYRSSVQTAQKALSTYESFLKTAGHMPQVDQLPAALPALAALHEADLKLNHHGILIHLLHPHADEALSKNIALLDQQQTIIFLPWMTQALQEAMLHAIKNNNNVLLYNSLKIYMMLHQPDKLDWPMIQTWLPIVLANSGVNAQDMPTVLALFQSILNNNYHPLILDDRSVANAQTFLKQLTPAELGLTLLQAHHSPNFLTLPIDNQAPGLHSETTQISTFYSAENFNTLYHKAAESAASEVLKGNWVQGWVNNNPISLQQLSTLSLQIQKEYIQAYANTWSALLSNITITPTQNENAFKEALSKNLPALLNIIHQNTNFAPLLVINPLFGKINDNLITQIGNLRPDKTPLHQLDEQISHLPDPMSTWVKLMLPV